MHSGAVANTAPLQHRASQLLACERGPLLPSPSPLPRLPVPPIPHTWPSGEGGEAAQLCEVAPSALRAAREALPRNDCKVLTAVKVRDACFAGCPLPPPPHTHTHTFERSFLPLAPTLPLPLG